MLSNAARMVPACLAYLHICNGCIYPQSVGTFIGLKGEFLVISELRHRGEIEAATRVHILKRQKEALWEEVAQFHCVPQSQSGSETGTVLLTLFLDPVVIQNHLSDSSCGNTNS